jgi:hypothetical protein
MSMSLRYCWSLVPKSKRVWTAISPSLMRRLSANTLLIGRLLKAGFGSQLSERPDLGIFLASAVQSGASTNVVRQLLDNGTDARQLSV